MELSSNLLTNKTALITGCNRGIGKAIVRIFAANGANIFACARIETPDFVSFLDEIRSSYGIEIKPIYFDLTNELQMKETLKCLIIDKIEIDILVNNAGVAHGGLLQMTSISKIREVFEVNFFSQLLIIQQVSKLMMRQKSGSIINLSSVVGIDSHPGYSAYGSSKAAIIYATKTLSKELAPYSIRVNAIAPGLTDTDMAIQMEKKAKENLVTGSAFNRLATSEEIANMALFLASDLSTFVNGQVVRVDGGM